VKPARAPRPAAPPQRPARPERPEVRVVYTPQDDPAAAAFAVNFLRRLLARARQR
jgi:hypothetical protein